MCFEDANYPQLKFSNAYNRCTFYINQIQRLPKLKVDLLIASRLAHIANRPPTRTSFLNSEIENSLR